MKILKVDLAERSYPIFIGEGIIQKKEVISTYINNAKVLIITNTTIAPIYLDKVKQTLSDYKVYTVILPDGEEYKNLATLNKIFDVAIDNNLDRQSTFIALGGGVIGDMVGFAAATYQRGVDFIQIPTTLLSQVDSSVGGKTGVNHPRGKNMIGSFHQPKCVIIDIKTLETLENKQISSGMAEVIKYGLIRSSSFFQWLEANMKKLLKLEPKLIIEAIEKSCKYKAEIVANDEKEHGQRALLNLGHTFGHAIEAGMGYGKWLHGEGVSAGTIQASYLSKFLGDLSEQDIIRIKDIFISARLPIIPPSKEAISTEEFLKLMQGDKKTQSDKIRLVLLRSIGEAYIASNYGHDNLLNILNSRKDRV